ncbi:MAG TPA: deoxyguanosinetriphosphate triphosphohydrolase [Terriglobales bacterium]|nr:deoxyguanosinetriphosphate triphosphohydrolase [Terriglobales bacterium]
MAPLAACAVHVEQSRGRRFSEPSHPYRNDFQRDRDRIIHSRAFRRLEAKTQVFTRRYSDHFRNRLTHTIEVAQISRTIAAQLGLNVDLVEALALAHDIGHPPFGHTGEKALDSVMREHGFFFDHNLHALRIVENFELRYAAFRGLNLTFEVREGIVKHSRDYDPAEFPELSEYLLDQQPPLEAQLIDVTDELAYNTADLDDGYEARLLTLDQIEEGLPFFARLLGEVEQRYPQAAKKLQFNEVLRRILDRWVGDLIQNTRVQVEGLGARLGKAAAAILLEDIRKSPARLVGLSDEIESERRRVKEFLYRNLYYCSTLQPEKEDAERIITELFDLWMKHPGKLPASYHEKAESEPLARVVCDYIAGMTDTYIYEQYEKFCGKTKACG